jgi:uncharacterized protein YigA (DUF484 family)
MTTKATIEELMTYSRRSLAEAVQASMAQVALLQQEWAKAEWQAGLLAAQRDEVLKYMADAPARDVCGHFDPIYRILITDPRDTARGE